MILLVMQGFFTSADIDRYNSIKENFAFRKDDSMKKLFCLDNKFFSFRKKGRCNDFKYFVYHDLHSGYYNRCISDGAIFCDIKAERWEIGICSKRIPACVERNFAKVQSYGVF